MAKCPSMGNCGLCGITTHKDKMNGCGGDYTKKSVPLINPEIMKLVKLKFNIRQQLVVAQLLPGE